MKSQWMIPSATMTALVIPTIIVADGMLNFYHRFVTAYRAPYPSDYTPPTGDVWQYIGCYRDCGPSKYDMAEVPSKLEHLALYNRADMTISLCQTECESLGFPVAGVTQGHSCYCGNASDIAKSFHAYTNCARHDEIDCDTPCTGNNLEWCGDSNKLNIFHKHPIPIDEWEELGCFDYSATINPVMIFWYYDWVALTRLECVQNCKQLGYQVSSGAQNAKLTSGSTLSL